MNAANMKDVVEYFYDFFDYFNALELYSVSEWIERLLCWLMHTFAVSSTKLNVDTKEIQIINRLYLVITMYSVLLTPFNKLLRILKSES